MRDGTRGGWGAELAAPVVGRAGPAGVMGTRRPGPGAAVAGRRRRRRAFAIRASSSDGGLHDRSSVVRRAGCRDIARPGRAARHRCARLSARGDGRGARDGRRRRLGHDTVPLVLTTAGLERRGRPGRADRRAGAGRRRPRSGLHVRCRGVRARVRRSGPAARRRDGGRGRSRRARRPVVRRDVVLRAGRHAAKRRDQRTAACAGGRTGRARRRHRHGGHGPGSGRATAAPQGRDGCSCWRCRPAAEPHCCWRPATPRVVRPSRRHRARRRWTP